MKNSAKLLPRFICVALLVALLLPGVSWLVWSFGAPVDSLFTDEGLRWLFRHALPLCFDETLFVCILAGSAYGVWSLSLRHPSIPSVRRRAMLTALCTGVCMLGVLSLAAFHPSSPLLSINGTLRHSPFSQGFFPLFFLCAIALGVVHAFVVGAVRSSDALVRALLAGVRDCADWFLLVLVFNFDRACVCYVLTGA